MCGELLIFDTNQQFATHTMRRAESGVLSVARKIFGRLDSDEYVNAASAIAMTVRIVRRRLRRQIPPHQRRKLCHCLTI